MKTLIVVSCSWGCGEWDYHDNNHDLPLTISHPGITEYLADTFKVVNLSRSGISNWQLCYTLHNYLINNPHSNFEVIVVSTDPARSKLSDKYIDLESIVKKTYNLESLYDELLEIFYHKLEYLAKLHNIKIHLIGGLGDLNINILNSPNFENLVPLCDSWIKLLYNKHVPSSIPLLVRPEILTITKNCKRYDLVDQAINYSDKNFLIRQQLLELDLFGPAYGDFHPSRKGHATLANYIKHFFKDIK
jgi:hypothetical protein